VTPLARALAAACLCVASLAARADAQPAAFRPCIDPNNLPFSNSSGDGFENRIARLFAERLGVPVESYATPQRMNFVRNSLRFKLPGQDYPCDVIMGVPKGYDQTSTTAPYYHSTYVLVFPRGKGFDAVTSGEDLFTAFADGRKKPVVGIYDRSPASIWLVKHGWEDQARPYRMLNADPEEYPGEIIAKDLVEGRIDAAVVWGPIGGYFAKRARGADLAVVPLKSEPGVKFDYEISMGVRYGEGEWKAVVEKLIADNRADITAILRQYNVPLVDEHGNVVN
jgi:quinoprotein dehydrogenase-associated probable ABC transporter substrate-binding protein